MARRKAIIDVGTNSIKFCLAEETGNGSYSVLKDANDIARLGEGLKETGLIGPEPLERNAQSVANFAAEAKAAGADEVVAVGTMALRTAKNAAAFITRVKELCGVELKVLSGEEEAQNSYVAVMSGIPGAVDADLVTMDTGGGSTEFVFGTAGKIVRKFSLNVGAVRFTEKYLSQMPVAPEKLAEAQAATNKKYVYMRGSTNVRTVPNSDKGSKVIGRLTDAVAEVLDTQRPAGSSANWYQVKYGNGTGWVFGKNAVLLNLKK